MKKIVWTRTSNLNVRVGPSLDQAIVGKLVKGTMVQVAAADGHWSRLSDGNWVSADYLVDSEFKVSTQGGNLNVRSAPSLTAVITDSLAPGKELHIVDSQPPWLKTDSGGWVHSEFLEPYQPPSVRSAESAPSSSAAAPAGTAETSPERWDMPFRTVRLVGSNDAKVAKVVRAEEMAVATTRSPDYQEFNKPVGCWNTFLLAGPIVRYATTTEVYIWIATSVPVAVDARIVATDDVDWPPENAIGSGSADSVKCGERLYTSLVAVKPFDSVAVNAANPTHRGFPLDQILFYNLLLTVPKDVPWRFGAVSYNAMPCAIHSNRIAIGGKNLPSFVLPGTSERPEAVFLHGSCRKLHGLGEDAITHALMALGSHANDPIKRPSALFLTGDQIYGDDVHPAVLKKTSELSLKILGWDERIVDAGFCSELMGESVIKRTKEVVRGDFAYDVDIEEHEGISKRSALLTAGRGGAFTSGESENHLIGFGEYAAIYLMAWSGEIWREFEPAGLGVPAPDSASAQQLMANIATYMMFDDHDITDDWNLYEKWEEDVAKHPVCNRVIANAMTAFMHFQACGNHPVFDSLRPALNREDTEGSDMMSFPWGGIGPRQGPWSFVAPTWPPVVMLDTRTRRRYDSKNGFPGLLDLRYGTKRSQHGYISTALSAASKAIKASGKSWPIVLVSPAPVLGLHLHDMAVKAGVRVGFNAAVDSEVWSGNEPAFFDFLAVLMESGHKRFVFLSGDVHYGFVCSANYHLGGRSIELIQFTASAFKNHAEGVLAKALAAKMTVVSAHYENIGDEVVPERVLIPAKTWDSYQVADPERGGGKLTYVFYRTDSPMIQNNAGCVFVGDAWAEQRLLSTGRLAYQKRVDWGQMIPTST